MRKSQKNNSKFGRFLFYKWSGPIVFAPIIILAIVVFVYMSNEVEFFTAWSCETIEDYLLNIDVPKDIPQHNDITDDQHIKLHRIHQECLDSEMFATPINHDMSP